MPTPKIADSIPAKATLEKGKLYSFCTCGHSEKQPFCDGAHREKAPEFKSFKFEAEKDGDVWLCQCKQTHNTPFCDGTHKEL
ncbi:MAG: CDGSH iron-sulfur domain-containing protein [Alphaproteobacteria bacterium]|nr:CDGSH iron-sulfur domain-containing protein [Alphaproteobacteria bacterium]